MFCFVLHFDQLFERNSSFLKKTLTRDGGRTTTDHENSTRAVFSGELKYLEKHKYNIFYQS